MDGPRAREAAKGGNTPPYRDLQIAAVAVANDLTVVTRNNADFELIHSVRTENWFEH